MKPDQKILNLTLNELPFSVELKKSLLSKKIKTLQNILDIPVYNWNKEFPGFTQHHQHEIMAFVAENDLNDHLKED